MLGQAAAHAQRVRMLLRPEPASADGRRLVHPRAVRQPPFRGQQHQGRIQHVLAGQRTCAPPWTAPSRRVQLLRAAPGGRASSGITGLPPPCARTAISASIVQHRFCRACVRRAADPAGAKAASSSTSTQADSTRRMAASTARSPGQRRHTGPTPIRASAGRSRPLRLRHPASEFTGKLPRSPGRPSRPRPAGGCPSAGRRRRPGARSASCGAPGPAS